MCQVVNTGIMNIGIKSSDGRMMVGIRGTCGWVALSEDKERFSICLLRGEGALRDGRQKRDRPGWKDGCHD
ncbi:MAG: hypothetical protein HFG47_11030 [Lachnospiraceae bacterium]|nr:hypothetical protein [Lachnospiraceae bacterium]